MSKTNKSFGPDAAQHTQLFRDVLEPFVSTGALAGAVTAVADRTQVLDVTTVGWADIAAQEPMRPDTLFWIASQTKPITATALMMLIEEGKVGLDDAVEKYLPTFHDPWVIEEQGDARMVLRKAHRPITVRDTLRHTSGMPFRSAMEEPTLDRLPLRETVQSYTMLPLNFQPGTEYHYSNAGINTAGRILEIVSGVPYHVFLQERLFDPLGMADTTFWPTAEQQRRLAKAYQPNATYDQLEETNISYLQYPLTAPARHPFPGGGLFSTSHDLLCFCRMILNGGRDGARVYLSQDSIAEMTRKQTGEAVPEEYGLGWEVGSEAYGHGGAYRTQMSIHASRDLITIFLVQHDGFILNGDISRAAFVSAATQYPFDQR